MWGEMQSTGGWSIQEVPQGQEEGEIHVPSLFPGKVQNDLQEHCGGVNREGTGRGREF